MSRSAQPYKRGSALRLPGGALSAMLKGRSASGWNPKDIERAVQQLTSAAPGSRTSRPPRATRPPRSR